MDNSLFDNAAWNGLSGTDEPDCSNIDYNDAGSLSRLLGRDIPSTTAAAARRSAKSRVSAITSSYKQLNLILSRHEATIQKRWIKKKKKKRLDVLDKAWGPGMSVPHRPDFAAFLKEPGLQKGPGRPYSHCFMWPYINQEDLLKTKTLPLLLNARGRHHPSAFAGADMEAMHLGIVTTALQPLFLNNYTMIIHPSPVAGEYGDLLSWDDHEEAFDWMHTRRQSLPGEALLILEAQDKLLDFLVKCCHEILHDVPADTLLTDEFPVQPEPPLAEDRTADAFQTLAIMAEEAPYRLPAKMDVDRIEALLGAKVAAIQDHIWALREDPAYFEDHIQDAKEHRHEMIKDYSGNIHPSLSAFRQHLFWTRVVSSSVSDANVQLEIFTELHRRAKEIQQVYTECAPEIEFEKPLPTRLLEPILEFWHFLKQAAKGPMQILKETVPPSPPWRGTFVREIPIDASSTKMAIVLKAPANQSQVEKRLLWLLQTIWDNGQNLFLASLSVVLDELERLIQKEPEAKQMISARVADTIGSLSIISQCLRQLELLHPWSRSFETDFLEQGRKERTEKVFAEISKPWGEILYAIKEPALARHAALFDPTDHKFSYPSGKRRTKQNTESLILAEKNLDRFWMVYDRLLANACGGLKSTALGKLLQRPRALQRTPGWVEPPVTAQSGKKKQQEPVSDDLEPIYKPLSTLYIGVTDKSPSSVATQPKTKTKTRGHAAASDVATTEPVATPSSVELAPKIPVDARAFKVFRVLFFDPRETSSPGEVSWADFVYAMTSTGVFSAEKLYGSVWQFEQIGGGGQSRIQFHEPHPSNKIPFHTLRRHGRRLNRHYGWTADSFVLKEKK